MMENKGSMLQLKALLKVNIRQYGMFIALLAILVIFSILTSLQGVSFLTPQNITNIYLQTGYIAVLAVGMVLVIVSGHIDLSVGSVAGFCGAVAAVLQIRMGLNTPMTIVTTLMVGALIGMWQGYWIAYRKIPSFIVTLAGMLIFQGLMLLVLQSRTIAGFNSSFTLMSQGYMRTMLDVRLPEVIFRSMEVGGWSIAVRFPAAVIHLRTIVLGILTVAVFIWSEKKKRRTREAYLFDVLPANFFRWKLILISVLIMVFMGSLSLYRGVPLTVLIVACVVLLYSFVTNRTTIGRHVYAIGGNLEASKLSGINAERTLFLVFVSMGVLAALSGMLFAARMDAATTTAGQLFELDAIAATFIGGASASGGIGSVVGAIVGALVMSTINNGMEMIGLEAYFKPIIKGAVLLLAVWFDISTRNKSK